MDPKQHDDESGARGDPAIAETQLPDRIRAIFEHSFQFAGLLSPGGILLEANPASLRFAQAEREEVVGRPFWETPWWQMEAGQTEEDRERLRDAVRRAAAGETVRYELEAVDPAGEQAVFDFSLRPIHDPEGGVEAIVAEGREITELYRTREALRFSRARLSAILSGALDAIISIDEEQRIRLFNEGAERIFGYSRDDVQGEPLDILVPELFREIHREHVTDFGKSPVAARLMGERGEIMGRRKDGELFPAEASIGKVEVRGRRVYTAVLRDISERKEAERERASLLEREQESRRKAEAAMRARDEMLRVVSHDLKNPVTGILMGTKMLRLSLASEPELEELLAGIELAAERQSRLIQDLRDVGAIEAGRLSVEPCPHQVAALLGEAARSFEPVAAEKGVDLRWEVAENLPAVLADRDRIVQVLSNLLDNALKFTPAGGSVLVEAALAEGEVEIAVRDTGPGIPEDERDLVFERFWRGAGWRDSGQLGTGLGLAIVRGIVESHGGQVGAESQPGRGSVFRFTLPVAGEGSRKSAPPTS